MALGQCVSLSYLSYSSESDIHPLVRIDIFYVFILGGLVIDLIIDYRTSKQLTVTFKVQHTLTRIV